MHKINHADIKEWAANYDGEPFDGILCDPPYGWSFMGKSWDYDVPSVEVWKLIYDLLKPGAHILVACGTRTQHRMAVNIEDAGFEIRDLVAYVYGSGFPKSLNIGKAVDKIQGNEREVVQGRAIASTLGSNTMDGGKANPDYSHTKGTSLYEGYGTALKPAMELWTLARKPIEGTVANNVLKHGTGGLAIDNCRVGTEIMTEGRAKQAGSMAWQGDDRTGGRGSGFKDSPLDNPAQHTGRFPANLIHDGSDEVVGLFPDTGKSTGGRIGNKGSMINTMGNAFEAGDPGYGDSGSAARFFYTAKASKSERNAGLEGFELKENAGSYEFRTDGSLDGKPTEAKANHHPTVKPLSLTKYLANLIKPPTGGRLLVPFSGSGSEMIGGLQAGWEYVEGVELTEEYIPIAEARIKYWLEQIQAEESKPKQVALV